MCVICSGINMLFYFIECVSSFIVHRSADQQRKEKKKKRCMLMILFRMINPLTAIVFACR